MKLSLLHETTMASEIAVKPAAFSGDGKIDITKPMGKIRWYLAFSTDNRVDGLMEKKGSSTLAGKQFGDQPKFKKTSVWQTQETKDGMTNSELYFPKGTIKSTPYGGSEMWHTPNPERQYKEHILKPPR